MRVGWGWIRVDTWASRPTHIHIYTDTHTHRHTDIHRHTHTHTHTYTAYLLPGAQLAPV